ncbi:uncharacterized protein B0T15DRAFT_515497 [Chaetomium strumarium]|uniref:Uncharacterized protein n=1 Tax=Chaetomium strumarium TaxID=1170767 RepID=A0AAJ0H094_9PEZI|nr:hypothetical protein B0T15DRAFT_515497 [Chaetomium strumarium]
MLVPDLPLRVLIGDMVCFRNVTVRIDGVAERALLRAETCIERPGHLPRAAPAAFSATDETTIAMSRRLGSQRPQGLKTLCSFSVTSRPRLTRPSTRSSAVTPQMKPASKPAAPRHPGAQGHETLHPCLRRRINTTAVPAPAWFDRLHRWFQRDVGRSRAARVETAGVEDVIREDSSMEDWDVEVSTHIKGPSSSKNVEKNTTASASASQHPLPSIRTQPTKPRPLSPEPHLAPTTLTKPIPSPNLPCMCLLRSWQAGERCSLSQPSPKPYYL